MLRPVLTTNNLTKPVSDRVSITVGCLLALWCLPPQQALCFQPLPSTTSRVDSSTAKPTPNSIKDENAVDLKPTVRYEFNTYTDVVYSQQGEVTLHCDVYLPKGVGPFPAVVAIHGGAWQFGSKLQMLRHAWIMAEAGYVVVAINYRLAPVHKFPAQVQDCKRAVRWIRSKSEKLKVNPDQIAAFGYSAGGHLSAMLGTTDSRDGFDGDVGHDEQRYSSRVQCVVVGGGPCEFAWVKNQTLVKWLGDSPQDNPDVYLKASPVHYVTEDDPPFIFFHGSNDRLVPKNSSQKMHRALKAVGVTSRYHIVEGRGHAGTFSDTSWLPVAISFMDEVLDRTHAP